MEELQSTETLEREILEDARKKALRILKTADETVIAKTAEWDKKTQDSICELEKKYNEQKELSYEKVMSRLPIDKIRSKVERIEELLRLAEETWYIDQERKRIIDLLTNDMERRLSLCRIPPAAEKSVFYYGLRYEEAQTIVKKAGTNLIFEEVASAEHYPFITLDTANFRITSSIQKIIDYLLADKRQELVEALVGGGFMEQK